MVAWWRTGMRVTWLLCFMQLRLARSQYDATNSSNKTELHIGFITSFGGQYNSSGTVPAVEMALEQINSRTDVLPNYTLSLHEGMVGDSQCDRTQSLNTFFRLISTGPPKLAVLGCGCSIATEPVAEISHHWNITQLSYASATSSLNDRRRFPNFWRTYPSEDNTAQPIVAVVKHYGWNQIKVITQDESLFTSTKEMLERDLKVAGVFVDLNGTTLFQSGENVATKENLFSPEIRVYVLNMYAQHARRVMCAAVRGDQTDPTHYYRGYVWITLGWYRRHWWTAAVAQDSTVNCTDEDLERFLARAIAVESFSTSGDDDIYRRIPTNVSLTAEEFREMYNRRLNGTSYNFERTAYLSYDAVWALAFAMNRAISPLQELGLSLDDFNYQTTASIISREIQAQLNDTDFQFLGVSGLVEFNENGTRLPTNPRILQYRNSTMDRNSTMENSCSYVGSLDKIEPMAIAYVSMNSSELIYLPCEDDTTTWRDGIPSDGTPEEVYKQIHQILFISYTTLAGAGILFAIFCMFFNIIFRKRKIVRLTSPNLNYLIILGTILLYTTVIFFVFPTTDATYQTIFCHIRAWTQFIGYFLCFGTIVAKVWRVYYIFHHPSAKRGARAIKDWHLFIFVLVLVTVSTAILIYMEAADMYVANPIEDQESPTTRNGDKVLVQYYVQKCDGRNSLIWIIIAYGYILLTQLASIFLAFRTRKVKVKVLNDSKYIALIIYITSVIVTVMIIGAVTLDNYINADAAVFSGLILTFTTVVLTLVFVPKMLSLYRDPKGQYIFERSDSMRRPTLTGVSTLNDHERDRMMELERHCRDIESRLAKYEHVEPIRSASKTRLFTGSLDNVRTHTLSTSAPTTPVHTVNPMFSVKTPNGYTSNHVQSSTPTQTSSATNPSFSDMSSAENMNSNTTELKAKRSDGRRFSDSEEQRNRKEPRDVNSTV